MRTWSVDSETYLIRPGCAAPKLVCVSHAERVGDDIIKTGLLGAREGMALVRRQLADPTVTVVGHHLFYDLGVFAAEDPSLAVGRDAPIWVAADDGRLRDTIVRQKMIDNATGELKYLEDEETGEFKEQNFSLDFVVYRLFGRTMDKGKSCPDGRAPKGCAGGHRRDCFTFDCAGCCPRGCDVTYRLRYGVLDQQPIASWPERARHYATNDAVETLEVHDHQEAIVLPEGIPGEVSETQAALALYLMSLWGVRTERVAVEKLKIDLEVEALRHWKVANGQRLASLPGAPEVWERDPKAPRFKRDDGSSDTKLIRAAIVKSCQERGVSVAMTDPSSKFPEGQVQMDRLALKKTRHPGLVALAEFGACDKILSTYVPALLRGCEYPIHAKYNPILETFRVSCAGPNMQNPPRKGGVRACFLPRDGWVFVSCDFDTIEMRALAQVCFEMFGYSSLREALNAGMDPHVALAADILGVAYDDAMRRYLDGDPEIEDARQAAKPGNFGFPGGMGWRAFMHYALTSYDVEVPPELAQKLHKAFRERWVEMQDYFAYNASMVGEHRCERVIFPMSEQVRGKVGYTQICNGWFQHRAAKGAKDALYEVSRECYTGFTRDGRPSPLAGSRPVIFMHDEIITEIPYRGREQQASDAADRVGEIMRDRMRRWIKDVEIKAGPVMMRRWLKGCKAVRIDGRLVPSRSVTELVPGKVDRKTGKPAKLTKWVADLDERQAA